MHLPGCGLLVVYTAQAKTPLVIEGEYVNWQDHPDLRPQYPVVQLAGKVQGHLDDGQASMQVTMSDWEQKALSQQQIVYAALDALVTGQLFRGLRLLHSNSSWGLSSS